MSYLYHPDGITWRSSTLVEKFSKEQTEFALYKLMHNPSGDELRKLCGEPELGIHEDPTSNLLTTAGLNRITSLIIAGGGQGVTNTAARLGVGDSTTAAAVGDTDLGAAAGSTHRQFYVMDATYPTQSNGLLTFKSTFASADANFAWQEWCVDVATPTVANGTTVNTLLLNHKIVSMGTKVSGSTWALTATITLS